MTETTICPSGGGAIGGSLLASAAGLLAMVSVEMNSVHLFVLIIASVMAGAYIGNEIEYRTMKRTHETSNRHPN